MTGKDGTCVRETGMLPARCADPTLRGRITLIAESFRRLMGRDLVTLSPDVVAALWRAPRAIVAHGTELDPIFFFGNQMALKRFEMSFDQFTATPSRLSAEPLEREARQALLERVTRFGFIDDYAGVRVSSTGQRFRIEQAIVWTLVAEDGSIQGQAAAFDRWTDL